MVAEYVVGDETLLVTCCPDQVRELTRTAAQAGVIRHHLGLIHIRRFMKENDGHGGLQYMVDIEVAETGCGLGEEYSAQRCPVGEREHRLCTAEVHEEHQPRKLARGVEIRRIEVTSTICKEPPVDRAAAAQVTDRDVVDVAKAVTLQIGRNFGASLWLVTRVVAARRQEVEGGTEYSLTLAMAESGCPRAAVEDRDAAVLYGGDCTVTPESATKTCQVVVTRQVEKFLAVAPVYRHQLADQVCAERRLCPSSCPEVEEPTCATDGTTYQSPCHLQVSLGLASLLPRWPPVHTPTLHPWRWSAQGTAPDTLRF